MIPAKIEQLDGQMTSWLKPYHLSASVQFGIEMALLNLKANEKAISLAQLINPQYCPKGYISGLLQGSTESVVAQAEAMLKDGYHTMKLKVGSADIDQDIAKVKAVNEVIEGKALLRLDANQAWSLAEAVKFGQAIGLNTVEYIEEPLKNIEEIPEFFEQTTLLVGADESLLTTSFEHLKALNGVEVFIIKPTVLGGIEKSWQLAQKARQHGLEPILSSSFETSLGLTTLVHLAAGLYRFAAVGLDTGKWFVKDLITNPLVFAHGQYDLSHMTLSLPNIQEGILEEILP